jgi:hypothetical protein
MKDRPEMTATVLVPNNTDTVSLNNNYVRIMITAPMITRTIHIPILCEQQVRVRGCVLIV